MAKFYTMPEFKSVDDVFAVLADQKRALKILSDMREMRDAINVRLGDLDSHEKAEASVAAANALIAEVNMAHSKAVEAVEAATVEAARIIDGARLEASSIIEKANEVDRQFKSNLADVRKRGSDIDKREAAVAVREAASAALATKLANIDADLVSREKQVAEKLSVAKRIAEAVAG